MKRPRIEIEVSGGLPRIIENDPRVDLVIYDYDIEGYPEEELETGPDGRERRAY